jgi:hypothetical protein
MRLALAAQLKLMPLRLVRARDRRCATYSRAGFASGIVLREESEIARAGERGSHFRPT